YLGRSKAYAPGVASMGPRHRIYHNIRTIQLPVPFFPDNSCRSWLRRIKRSAIHSS
ncbi:hypothetical protein FRC11_001379, partial [Ceratobasidium sp. 423]